jgi:hypothetical protein
MSHSMRSHRAVPKRLATSAILACALATSAACGPSSSGSSGMRGTGTDSGGANWGGTAGHGGAGTGGSITVPPSGAGGTVAGAAGCGTCPRNVLLCEPQVSFTILANVGAQSSEISDLTADVPGVPFSCKPLPGRSPCQWECVPSAIVPVGQYTATISAPGYETATVEFDLTTPCGCCSCRCAQRWRAEVQLSPAADPAPACCAALATDPNNCGECGRVCPQGVCTAGTCE